MQAGKSEGGPKISGVSWYTYTYTLMPKQTSKRSSRRDSKPELSKPSVINWMVILRSSPAQVWVAFEIAIHVFRGTTVPVCWIMLMWDWFCRIGPGILSKKRCLQEVKVTLFATVGDRATVDASRNSSPALESIRPLVYEQLLTLKSSSDCKKLPVADALGVIVQLGSQQCDSAHYPVLLPLQFVRAMHYLLLVGI